MTELLNDMFSSEDYLNIEDIVTFDKDILVSVREGQYFIPGNVSALVSLYLELQKCYQQATVFLLVSGDSHRLIQTMMAVGIRAEEDPWCVERLNYSYPSGEKYLYCLDRIIEGVPAHVLSDQSIKLNQQLERYIFAVTKIDECEELEDFWSKPAVKQRACRSEIEELIRQRRSGSPRSGPQLTLADLEGLAIATFCDRGRYLFPAAGGAYCCVLSVLVRHEDGDLYSLYEYQAGQSQLLKKRVFESALVATILLGQQNGSVWNAYFAISWNHLLLSRKYGSRASRFCHISSGAFAQSMQLFCEKHGLSSRVYGGFDDAILQHALGLRDHLPSLLVGVS
jgi:SagB-type dehydrogenase family enzyme